MPIEAKPLFRLEVLRPLLASFQLPSDFTASRTTLVKWAGLLSSGQADTSKEKELLPDFLADFLCGVLGYKRKVDEPARFTVSWEKHVQVGGKYADGVIGEFRLNQNRYVIAIEGKGPKDPLDRPYAGRKSSAVEQGYGYAINLPCQWIVVTSMRETRLYHKGSDQHTFESFDTIALASDDSLLRKFVFLLGADRVVPSTGPCHLDELIVASEKVGKDLTKEYYVQYANMREDVFEKLCKVNPEVKPSEVLASTQKVLDRILFCAFSEDRGLLPTESIKRAYEHADPYNPRPIWDNFRGLFRSVNKGNPQLSIPAYNGGLFADDPNLDRLVMPDEVCLHFRKLAEYEYRPALQNGEEQAVKLVDVDILGHIFEQSINDLERLHNELEGREEKQGLEQHASRRKKEGAFYTPAFITRYIVGEALGSVLADKFEALRVAHASEAKDTARRVLTDPRAFDSNALNIPQRTALIRFWEAWQDEGLANFRILDPSCGSGAFLIEAFEQLYQAYQRSNDQLSDLRGERTLFDLDRRILQNNLYGVDLNDEAVQICRLSLWIKTAQRGKVLTSLDHNIRVGNSVIADPDVHPRAFIWQSAFPEVFEQGGFDVVLGNPPYVRQEWIAPFKPYFQRAYKSYHGVADLFVYFYELGMRLLKPGGRLSFIVTNKWLKAGFGEPLRRYFSENAWIESVVDFGHAKQIFLDADVFPCIIIARKPNDGPIPGTIRVSTIPREQLRINDLSSQIATEGYTVERSRLGRDAWSLEPTEVVNLLTKMCERGIPLADFAGVKPLMGIKTGLNEAFLISSAARNALIETDPSCKNIIRSYLRGQDIKRWNPEWNDLWMIAMRSSENFNWPWSQAGELGEDVFRETYPSLYDRMKPLEAALRKRQDQGRYWWELRSCAYWHEFEKAKLIYQDITWRPSFCLDKLETVSNNTVYFLPTSDFWLLSVLNSPIGWWFAWRKAQHGKDEALRYFTTFVEEFPLPQPLNGQRERCDSLVGVMIESAQNRQSTIRNILDWLKFQHEIPEPSTKLQNPIALDSDALITEVRKLRGKKKPLSLAAIRDLRDEHVRTIEPAQALAVKARQTENELSDLVNEAYGLTPEEVKLIWETAPPRMPISPPLLSS